MENSNVNKMQVIININTMRSKCGMPSRNVDQLLKKSYNELHEAQNMLVEHYNEALRNAKTKTV